MGLMNKIKGILFDEDEIEVQVDSDELPGMPPKEVKHLDRKVSSGIIEHHREEEVEEDTIKEIVIPSYDEQTDIKPIKETNKFDLVDDEEMDRDFPINNEDKEIPSRTLDDFDVDFNYGSRSSLDKEDKYYKTVDEVRKEYNIGTPVKKHSEEIKDYRKMLNNEPENTKKPFTVTPVISPVYGILDKNYKADEIEEKRELISKTNSGVKPRMFGPVSYNDEPLPTLKKSETPLKKDLVELNTTINELISDSITSDDVETAVKKKRKEKVVEEELKTEEDIPVSVEVPDEEEIIKTENYDEYENTSIENEYIGNNNIEDAFDSTDEYKRINESDDKLDSLDDTESSIDVDALIDKKDDDDDDQELNNTIETDLFNLIDSMYKSDDKEETEEE